MDPPTSSLVSYIATIVLILLYLPPLFSSLPLYLRPIIQGQAKTKITMANSLLLLVALVVAGCTALASATTYTVGDSQGWTTNFDYSTWASGKSFAVGDKLVFSYMSKAHSVTEVSKSGYDTCSGTNPLSDDESGSTVITLQTPGTHYFICNVPGHCANGMKLAVAVAATPSGTTPSAAGALQVPAMASVVAAAAGAAIKFALF